MGLTLNQVLQRIKTVVTAHNQVRTYVKGLVPDFTTDQTTKYPAVFLQDGAGSISTSGHSTTLNFRMFFLDLVNIIDNEKTNVSDVQSDMLSVAMDILAELSRPELRLFISTDNSIQLLDEGDDTESNADMPAGCYVDFSVRIVYEQNVCAVPSDVFNIPGASGDSVFPGTKQVLDLTYTATGLEDNTITIESLKNQRILMIAREGTMIYEVSNLPDSVEYTWDNTSIVTGKVIGAGERFLILYRNY